VLLLELHGAQVAEHRMQPAAIVYVIDEVRDVRGGILEALLGHRIVGLDLQCLHDALGICIVVRIAAPPDRADQTMCRQQGAIRLRSLMRSRRTSMDRRQDIPGQPAA
jgi:hypothetical protein